MKSLIVYDSQFGNTEKVAQAIGSELGHFGPAKVVRVTDFAPTDFEGVELLVVGSPIQGHRPTEPIQSFLINLTTAQVAGIAVAAFDTRLRMPGWLTGSAAKWIARRLVAKGSYLSIPAEGFRVAGTEGPLLQGELDRASRWAGNLIEQLTSAPATPAAFSS